MNNIFKNCDVYQKKANTFSLYEKKNEDSEFEKFIYPSLGLAEEAGEVAGKFAKIYRDKNGKISEQDKQEVQKELGDVCWFVAEIATKIGINLSSILKSNIIKLEDRQKRGVIQGNGDNR